MRLGTGILVGACFLLAVAAVCGAGGDTEAAESSLLAQLRDLEPLPKVHYSWPLPYKSLADDLLYEYVRLTHAASLSGEWCKPEDVDRSVLACGKVNRSGADIPASLGINFSVWHRRFDADLPPTDTGPTHQAELAYLRERLVVIRELLLAANRKHGTRVEVTAVLFDSERFHTRTDDPQWNDAVTAKYDAAFLTVQEVFPPARVEWYARGAIRPSSSPTGWSETTHFSLQEMGETLSCSLYRVPEIGITRETFRRTAENATAHGCSEVTPWIALAAGYRRQTDEFHEFSLDWDYDLIYSWQLGAEINYPWFSTPARRARFAPWQMAKIAVFYPEPLGRVPHWGRHFVAYVKGAHLIHELGD